MTSDKTSDKLVTLRRWPDTANLIDWILRLRILHVQWRQPAEHEREIVLKRNTGLHLIHGIDSRRNGSYLLFAEQTK